MEETIRSQFRDGHRSCSSCCLPRVGRTKRSRSVPTEMDLYVGCHIPSIYFLPPVLRLMQKETNFAFNCFSHRLLPILRHWIRHACSRGSYRHYDAGRKPFAPLIVPEEGIFPSSRRFAVLPLFFLTVRSHTIGSRSFCCARIPLTSSCTSLIISQNRPS